MPGAAEGGRVNWGTGAATYTLLIVPSRKLRSVSEVLVPQSCPTLCDPRGLQPTRLLGLWDSPGKDIGLGCHALLQGIFPARGSNSGLLHCRQILYQLSHQGSP